MSLRACCILCKCLTVSSRMSAFSSLDTFSPCACKAAVMMSLSSSRHLLIRARRFLSSKGFIIFLYCVDLDIFSVLSSGELEEFNVDEGDEDELLFELELDDGLVDKFKPTGLKLALVKCAGKCEK